MTRSVLSLVILLWCVTASAQLHFDSKEKIIKATPTQKAYKATFKFTNGSNKEVTITKIKSSCACMVMDLKKRVYKPGESGELAANLIFGRSKGKFVKKIYVNTKSDKPTVTTLTIGAIIPEFARVTPRFLRWQHGDPVEEKTIKVSIIHNEPIKVLKVTSSNPSWKPTLKVVKEGWEYEVRVNPPSTAKASRAALSIEVDYPKEQHLIFRAVARVTQPPKPQKVEGWLKKLLK